MNGDRSPVFPQSPLLARALPGCVRIAKMCLGRLLVYLVAAMACDWEEHGFFTSIVSRFLKAVSHMFD